MSDAKPRAKPGRPSQYTLALAERICELVAKGTPVHRIGRRAGFPQESTVYDWLNKHSEFAEMYARARDRAADRFASELLEIADKAPETIRGVEKARLRIDARKWAAAKFAPRKYGERILQEHSGQLTLAQLVEAANKQGGEGGS